VGTTKLTRKEILSEDPVNNFILHSIEFFRVNGSKAAGIAIGIVLLAFAIFGGFQYLEKKKEQAQVTFKKGLDFFHAEVRPDATDDPYSRGPFPIFKSETAKYQAAAKEFSTIASGHIYGKLGISARYCLGITQLHLGQNNEAMQNLESVASNSSNRTLGFLAKRSIAVSELNEKNYKKAQDLLEGMVKDPQCDIQKADLSILLSRVFVAQGKRDDAIRVLKEASGPSPAFDRFSPQLMTEMQKILKTP
jgi:predicted negative regulator of RcsB-dependent stress response